MDGLLLLGAGLANLLLFGALAITRGADSRGGLPDDRRRSARG